MAKPPPSYTTVKLTPAVTAKVAPLEEAPSKEADVASTMPVPPAQAGGLALRSGKRRPMEEKADPTVLYLHPEGKMALKRYALDRGSKVRVHDLLLEAIEQWARSKGLDVPFRVPSQRAPKVP